MTLFPPFYIQLNYSLELSDEILRLYAPHMLVDIFTIPLNFHFFAYTTSFEFHHTTYFPREEKIAHKKPPTQLEQHISHLPNHTLSFFSSKKS